MNLIYLGWVYVAILTGGGYAHVTCDHCKESVYTSIRWECCVANGRHCSLLCEHSFYKDTKLRKATLRGKNVEMEHLAQISVWLLCIRKIF